MTDLHDATPRASAGTTADPAVPTSAAPARDLVVTAIGTTLPPAPGADGWFDQRAELGRGYKKLPAACQYLLSATRRALAAAGGGLETTPEERRAVAIGSNHGAARIHTEVDAATTGGEAHLISPAAAPYFSPNLIAGRLAIEHALKGFSLGVHTPGTGGLEAVHAGLRALRFGRADWLLAGAAEEPPPADDKALALDGTPEDGAVALVFEPASAVAARGGRSLGTVTARVFCLPPAAAAAGDGPEHARRLLAAALAGLGLPRLPADGVRLITDGSPVADALARACEGRAEPVAAGAGCLGPVRQVADALGAAEPRLIITAGRAGTVAVARVSPAPHIPLSPMDSPTEGS
ncbi:beta-ketoacyl synthase N-terminal-like domain-containing protein [Streptomyces sp. SAJ15]|uniref:beta-ketoacyl synthase N-terminal-like domain-containing protein n=1 Tax=Streptomyces sp. SAJ15 TaxID=2011095 RepID=UPI001184C0F8|nr:beta-ketoacyl synthase N-terminal-like domain-containing protein [Streptomyces sp. SAJ15]TVL88957.1 3-oxoacyl-ACP synthase [Streptomyces sp. SAJ15]